MKMKNDSFLPEPEENPIYDSWWDARNARLRCEVRFVQHEGYAVFDIDPYDRDFQPKRISEFFDSPSESIKSIGKHFK